jgi:hypothetical protein
VLVIVTRQAQGIPPRITSGVSPVQQLTGLDYMFILQESPRTPMHISPVVIYDTSDMERGVVGGGSVDGSPADGSPADGSPVRFKEILTVFERNLHKSPVFRRKLLSKTRGFDTPYWIEDDHFDLEFHVRHIALPKPGD